MIVGNDVASFQGDINYDVYKSNTNFVIVKATEGTGFTDPKFKRNQTEARRTNIPLGYYHFARPDLNANAEAEADYFLTILGEIREGEVLVLDYEPNWNGNAVAWCKQWLDHIYSKINCKPLIYLNQSQIKSWDWSPISNAGYGLWVAAYTYDPNNNNFVTGAWKFAAMQQWTNKQQVPGIPTIADGDAFFGDVATFKKYGYAKPVPVDPCDTIKKELEQVKSELGTARTQLDQANKTVADLTGKLSQANTTITTLNTDINALRAKIDKAKTDLA